MTSADGAGKLYYVKNVTKPEGKEYEVDLRNDMKSLNCCDHVLVHLQPCRHCVPVFWKEGMLSSPRKVGETINRYWPKWARVDTYLQTYANRSIAKPELHAGTFRGPETDRLLPPAQPHKRRGRPKKKRYRFRKKTKKSVEEAMPTVHDAYYADVLTYF